MGSWQAARNLKAAKADYFTSADLKSKGWTKSLIERFLENPDTTDENPYHLSGPPIKLYLKKRVLRIEKSKSFVKEMKETQPRKTAAAKGVNTKRNKLLKEVEDLEIVVPRLEWDKLIQFACDDFNISRQNYDMVSASPDSSEEFLHRICVNFLRHQMTSYEWQLEQNRGKVGADDAYLDLKDKVLDAITEAYPKLAEECFRQWKTANKI